MSEASVPRLPPLDRRVPPWRLDALSPRACPFCDDAGQPRFVRPDGVTLRSCTRCGTFFVSPAPDEAQLADFYARYYQSHSVAGRAMDAALARDLLDVDPLDDPRVAEFVSLMDLRGRRALDVGCGLGRILVCLSKLGAAVTGVDPDPDAVAFIRERLGLADVHRGLLRDLDPQRRFDLITLDDLIEHPLRPLEVLIDAQGRLNPGGLISLWTPNASFADEDPEPTLFRVDLEHMQYLSHRTCRFLADRLGMDIAHLESLGHPVLDGLTAEAAARPASAGRSLRSALKRLPGMRALNRARHRLLGDRSRLRTGRYHLFCIFRKPPA